MKRRTAWILILIVEVSFIFWGGMAAAFPDHLMGPGGKPILPAGYEGFTGSSWAQLASTSPSTAGYVGVLFRTYGMYNLAFGVMGAIITLTAFRRGDRGAWWALLAGNAIALISAMVYDRTVKAIGPFEWSEYLGLAMVLAALVATAPFLEAKQPVGATSA